MLEVVTLVLAGGIVISIIFCLWWRHAKRVSLTTEEWIEVLGYAPPERFFTAREIGKLDQILSYRYYCTYGVIPSRNKKGSFLYSKNAFGNIELAIRNILQDRLTKPGV